MREAEVPGGSRMPQSECRAERQQEGSEGWLRSPLAARPGPKTAGVGPYEPPAVGRLFSSPDQGPTWCYQLTAIDQAVATRETSSELLRWPHPKVLATWALERGLSKRSGRARGTRWLRRGSLRLWVRSRIRIKFSLLMCWRSDRLEC